MMKKIIYFMLTFFLVTNLVAQEKENQYPDKGNQYYDIYHEKYMDKNDKYIDGKKRYDSWSLHAYIGPSAIYTGDLMSDGDNFEFGLDAQVGATKWFNHAFGVESMIQFGRTKQSYGIPNLEGNTKYVALNFNGVLNLNTVFRRGDLIPDDSKRKWNAYVFAGVGFMKFKAKTTNTLTNSVQEFSNDSPFRTIHVQTGGILSRRITNNLDVNARINFLLSGRDHFDGALKTQHAQAQERLLTANIGLTYHFGKREKLVWTDPYMYKIEKDSTDALPNPVAPLVLKDDDNDGVINRFDKDPNTPSNVIVDGSGVPLDTDKDGVYDSIDDCPLVKGSKSKKGCPEEEDIAEYINLQFVNVRFDTDKSFIKNEYIAILNNAAYVMKQHPNVKFMITGYTDCRSDDSYNISLSERRANAVKDYLINKNGVPASQLYVKGVGENAPINECKPCSTCAEKEHFVNRRIEFTVVK